MSETVEAAEDRVNVCFTRLKKMKSDMALRYYDKAFYYAMLDAAEGKDDLKLVGLNVFRPEVNRPVVDDFIMDEEVVTDILGKLGHQGPV